MRRPRPGPLPLSVLAIILGALVFGSIAWVLRDLAFDAGLDSDPEGAVRLSLVTLPLKGILLLLLTLPFLSSGAEGRSDSEALLARMLGFVGLVVLLGLVSALVAGLVVAGMVAHASVAAAGALAVLLAHLLLLRRYLDMDTRPAAMVGGAFAATSAVSWHLYVYVTGDPLGMGLWTAIAVPATLVLVGLLWTAYYRLAATSDAATGDVEAGTDRPTWLFRTWEPWVASSALAVVIALVVATGH